VAVPNMNEKIRDGFVLTLPPSPINNNLLHKANKKLKATKQKLKFQEFLSD
jgi:hypothetical protein